MLARRALPRRLELLGRRPTSSAACRASGCRSPVVLLRGGGDRASSASLRDHRGDRGAVPGRAGGDPGSVVAGVGGVIAPGLLLPGAVHRDDEHRRADQRDRGRAAGRGRRSPPATGCRPSSPLGLAVTVVGVVLASREQHDDAERRRGRRSSASCLALVAAVGFGSYFVLSDAAADDSVLWLLALSRIIPVPALALFAWRAGCARRRAHARSSSSRAGTLDCGATALYARGQHEGRAQHRRGRRLAVSGDDADPRPRGARRAHPAGPAGGRRGGAGRRRDDRRGLA